MGAESLIQFLIALCLDPSMAEAVKRDPGVLAKAPLSEQDKNLIRSGDQELIRSAYLSRVETTHQGGMNLGHQTLPWVITHQV